MQPNDGVKVRRWTERWHGSGPDRGWWVWEAEHGDSIAYCGEGEFAERLCSLIVQKHNDSLGVRVPDGGQQPHTYGPAICEDCGHRWMAVWPLGAEALECPKCHSTNTDREQEKP